MNIKAVKDIYGLSNLASHIKIHLTGNNNEHYSWKMLET